jgi:sphinganine-1-phosphate aldolase
MNNKIQLPQKGTPKDELLNRMRAMRSEDIKLHEGKAFLMSYDPGAEAAEVLRAAYNLFFEENALNPTAFPSLRRMETEVIAMTADLLGGDSEVVGNMTSGGTESILLAVMTARNWARANKPEVTAPEMLLPETIHPAFEKAAEYFGVKAVHYPVDAEYKADVEAARATITANTILMAGSAPTYPHGVVDPIRELAAIAQEHGVLFHSDSCLGGYFLPFARRLGYPVTDFDFQVPGVTSISADLHKFGYAAKPASVVLYKNLALRRHQIFVHADWSGGIYASGTMAGSRPGGAIAAAWAIMNHLGEEGYLRLTGAVMEAANRIRGGIEAIEGLKILGNPEMSVMALAAEGINIYEVGDELGLSDWYMERQQFPASLHMTINYGHTFLVDEFLNDLEEAAKRARKPSLRKIGDSIMLTLAQTFTRILPENLVSQLTSRAAALLGIQGSGLPERSAAMYGMMGSLPNRGDIKEMVLDIVEQFTVPQER